MSEHYTPIFNIGSELTQLSNHSIDKLTELRDHSNKLSFYKANSRAVNYDQIMSNYKICTRGNAWATSLKTVSTLLPTLFINAFPQLKLSINTYYENLLHDDRGLSRDVNDTHALFRAFNMYGASNNTLSVDIHYIGAGITVLRNILQNPQYQQLTEEYTELTAVENRLKLRYGHTIKILMFKPAIGNGSARIKILTNVLTEELMDRIMVSIPVLFNLINKPDTTTQSLQSNPLLKHIPLMELEAFNTQDILKDVQEMYELAYNYIFAKRLKGDENQTQAHQSVKDQIQAKANAFFEKHYSLKVEMEKFLKEYDYARKNGTLNYLSEQIRQHNTNIDNLYKTLQAERLSLVTAVKKHHAMEYLSEGVDDTVDEVLRIINLNPEMYEMLTIPSAASSSNKNTLIMRFTAPLRYFNSDDFIAFFNPTSNIFHGVDSKIREPYKKLLRKIFVDREYQLLAQSVLSFRYEPSNNVTLLLRGLVPYDPENYTTLPNPHYSGPNCLGETLDNINTPLYENRLDLALPSAINAVSSINILETRSMILQFVERFLNKEHINKWKIINPKGVTINLFEALEEMKTLSEEDKGVDNEEN